MKLQINKKPHEICYTIHLCLHYNPRNFCATITARKNCTILYILKGEYKYTTKNNVTTAATGDVIYVPCNSSYVYEVLSGENTECLQIEYSAYDTLTNEIFTFGKEPTVFTGIKDLNKIHSLFSEALDIYVTKPDGQDFLYTSVMNGIFGTLIKSSHETNRVEQYKKIIPAVEYIKNNFTKSITLDELATLCTVSKSLLLRSFKNYIGTSPIEYKNNLLYTYVTDMLKSSDLSISEIADIAGFNSIYSFSKLFRRRFNISPNQYRKLN